MHHFCLFEINIDELILGQESGLFIQLLHLAYHLLEFSPHLFLFLSLNPRQLEVFFAHANQGSGVKCVIIPQRAVPFVEVVDRSLVAELVLGTESLQSFAPKFFHSTLIYWCYLAADNFLQLNVLVWCQTAINARFKTSGFDLLLKGHRGLFVLL